MSPCSHTVAHRVHAVPSLLGFEKRFLSTTPPKWHVLSREPADAIHKAMTTNSTGFELKMCVCSYDAIRCARERKDRNNNKTTLNSRLAALPLTNAIDLLVPQLSD